MRYAILADIHGNLDALQVVLEDCKQQKCTHYVCLGDVVGYGANPKECLDIIRGMNIPVVKGNHDEYIGSDDNPDGFNDAAAEAVNWTRQQLTEDDRKWLRDLKYFRLVANFSIVHATLDAPQRWGYVFDKLAAAASFTYQNTSVCFFGHTHVPVAFIRDSMVRGGTYSKFKVGAAIRSASGRVYAGCNIENAAYPQGTCAEASAIAIMVSSGEREIAEVLTVCDGDLLGTCCGGCRQKIREFAVGTAPIYACGPDGLRRIFTLDELLPVSFGPEHLL